MGLSIERVGINTTVVTIVENAAEWFILAVKKETSGTVVIGHRSTVNQQTGMELSGDVYCYMVVGPGSSVYAWAPDEQAVSVVRQPAPFLAMLMSTGQVAQQQMAASCQR